MSRPGQHLGLRGAGLGIGSCIDGRLDLSITGTIQRQRLLPESGIAGEEGDEVAAVIDEALGVSCAGSCTQPGFVISWVSTYDYPMPVNKAKPPASKLIYRRKRFCCRHASRCGCRMSGFLCTLCGRAAIMAILAYVSSATSADELQDDGRRDARFWAEVAGKVEAARAHRSTAAAKVCMVDILTGCWLIDGLHVLNA